MKRVLTNALMMFSVCFLSLSLLVYVVQGKATRTYEQFYREAGVAQGQLIRNTVEAFLRQDVPLRQFAGFNALTESLLTAKGAIAKIAIQDEKGEEIFSSHVRQPVETLGGRERPDDEGPGFSQDLEAGASIELPLRSKFETTGKILIQIKLEEISARVTEAFQPIWLLMLAASTGFTLITLDARAAKSGRKRPWTAIAFAATLIGMAAVVIVTLVTLYADGASAKGRALLTSLSGRLNDVTEYGLNFDQIEGLDRVFADYRQLHTDISAIALIIDGSAVVHTDRSRVAAPWKTLEGTYDHVDGVSESNDPRSIQVAMSIPKDLVYRQVIDSVRNILALFVACGFFAYFFMNLAQSLQGARDKQSLQHGEEPGIALGLVKPVFFLATFVEHLNYAFLPQYVQGMVQELGVQASYTSVPFIAYYLCFAAVLIPAGRAELRFGPHRLIWLGLILAACGLLILAGQLGFVSVVSARALSGIGQGVLFIGVQSYILRTTSSEKRTRGASIVVIGFQAGMISGMAIGSLLVAQLGTRGVFELGAAVAAGAAFYAWAVIPKIAVHGTRQARVTAWRSTLATLRDLQFLRTIVLIGLPAKAVLTGVILFALPLLLANNGFSQEDIGQITMIYAASVVASSAWISTRADRPHATGGILVLGAVLSGAGLLLISTLGWKSNLFDVRHLFPSALLIAAGAVIVGVAHGFINAPVVTHVTESKLSARLGAGSVAAAYRLLERAGHTAGPIIVGQVIAYAGSSLLALGWIGGALIALGLLFAVLDLGKEDGLEPEAA